jgi:hypothetical protein
MIGNPEILSIKRKEKNHFGMNWETACCLLRATRAIFQLAAKSQLSGKKKLLTDRRARFE